MNQEHEQLIPESDAVEMVRLLGSVGGMNAPIRMRKRALMEGLAKLVEADLWLWSVNLVDVEDNRPISIGVVYDGLSEEQFNGWLEATQTADPPPPEDKPIAALFQKGMHFTRTRNQVVPDDEWYNHPTVKEFRIRRGIEDFVYSVYPYDHVTGCSALGFFRRVGEPHFTARQRRMIHILASHVEWLHFAELPDRFAKTVPEMSPRLRTVMLHLVDGRRRDEIANLLHISSETAKEHIRKVYRHFGVGSQVELMRKFQIGDGLDV